MTFGDQPPPFGGGYWLTPIRCRIILAALLLLGFLLHLRYLTHNCPIDLSPDEAHYWDWSRQLDLSYYSKGPLVAYIIRASCAVFGNQMWAVRLPALVLAVGSALMTYVLTRKLFASDRVAMGAVMLNHVVPMFIAGSVLMTIDPPFFFCWALATYLAAGAILEDRKSLWIWIGIVVGVGFLAKYAMFLWFVGLVVFMLVDRRNRKRLAWVCAAAGIALIFTLPVVMWNYQHHWVSLRHVARQTGVSGAVRVNLASLGEFIAGQIVVVGPALAVIIGAAVVLALRIREKSREMRFLLAMGLPFFFIVMLTSLRTKVQVNWPAPAYFSLMILATWFLATRMRDAALWRRWRPWLWATVITGIVITPIAHDTSLIYPLLKHVNKNVSKLDPSYRMCGWRELAQFVAEQQRTLSPNSFVLCEKYEQTAELAFYLPGQPKTFYAGSYFVKLSERQRMSQYDIWPDRVLDQPNLLGRDAIYVGYPTADIERAFESVKELPQLDIYRRGLMIRPFHVARCRGFKGMRRPADAGTY